MNVRLPISLLALCVALAPMVARSQRGSDRTDFSRNNVKLARQLRENTVTIRILPAEQSAPSPPAADHEDKADQAEKTQVAAATSGKDAGEAPAKEKPTDSVTVCTGVALGRGRIVTFAPTTTSARFRVTLPDGAQAEARLEVADAYSGLRLLAIDQAKLKGLVPCPETPRPGFAVMAASAAGIQQPSIAWGIVSATDRTVGKANLPLMLQCDLLTTETSSGAGLVNDRGELIGIVAAADSPDERRGWTYAVPATHVARILREQRPGQFVQLQRRRPTVGWTLAPGDQRDTVVVQRVFSGGPAEKAGIRRGDLICQADEKVIRNAYQAVNLILNKQPGDRVQIVVDKAGEKHKLNIILGDGSGVAVNRVGTSGAENPFTGLSMQLGINGRGELERPTTKLSEIEMLRRQLDAYELIIRRQQEQLRRLERLQRELNEAAPPPAAPQTQPAEPSDKPETTGKPAAVPPPQ